MSFPDAALEAVIRQAISKPTGDMGLTSLSDLYLSYTSIVDLAPLVSNAGLGTGDDIWIEECTALSSESLNTHIPALETRGVTVHQ